jgi:hypothetical protein
MLDITSFKKRKIVSLLENSISLTPEIESDSHGRENKVLDCRFIIELSISVSSKMYSVFRIKRELNEVISLHLT